MGSTEKSIDKGWFCELLWLELPVEENTIGLKSCAGGVLRGEDGLKVLQLELKDVDSDENEEAKEEQLDRRFLGKLSMLVLGVGADSVPNTLLSR